jgi:hypothetical protein
MSKQNKSNKPNSSSQDPKFNYSSYIREFIGLSCAQKSILYSLASRMGSNDIAWPSLETLALDSGLTKKNLLINLKYLTEIGLIAQRKNAGKNGVNIYEILGVSLGYPWDGEGCLLVTPGVSLRHEGVLMRHPKYKKKINENKNDTASPKEELKWWRQ